MFPAGQHPEETAMWKRLTTFWKVRHHREALRRLDDRLLQDVGVRREDIDARTAPRKDATKAEERRERARTLRLRSVRP
jgi:uncharacterized protein YjiS (DUF1127 family)